MRALTLVLCLAVACCTTVGKQNPYQLTPTHIGPVRLGMSEPEIGALGLRFRREMAEGEGGEFIRIVLDIGDELLVVADLYDGHADSLETASQEMTTKRGAHVGMTLAQLRQLYPDARVNIGNTEGHYFNLRIADGAFFEFDTSRLPESCFEHSGDCPDLSHWPSVKYFLRDYSR